MRCFVVALVLVLSGCSKCGASAAKDAGAPKRRSIDVRTALIYAYPEFRGTALLSTVARVTRVIPGLDVARRDEALKTLRFVAPTDGGSGWDLLQFHLEARGPETLEISIPLDEDHVAHLYIAHTGVSSQEMAQYLPRQLPIGSERFTLEIEYSSAPERCEELVRQATGLLLATQQWKVVRLPEWDAGAPEAFVAELRNDEGARVTWDRNRGRVRVVYELETYVP